VKIDKSSVSKLYNIAAERKAKVEFTFTDSHVPGALDRWEAICSLNGKEAGRAKAKNMQEAKHRVAAMLLEAVQNGKELFSE